MKKLSDVIKEHGLSNLYFHRNNAKAVELAEAGLLIELPSGELWIAGELAGFALSLVPASDFFHVRKVYDFWRSNVMFCGRVDECLNFVQAVEGEPGHVRAARRNGCRCYGEATPLEVCQATGALHRWERAEPHAPKVCGDCQAEAAAYFAT